MSSSSGKVVGIAHQDDGLSLVVFVEGAEHTDTVHMSHDMQMQVLAAITKRLSNKAVQLAWLQAGHPVPADRMD